MRLSLFPLRYIVPGLAATLLPVGIAQAFTVKYDSSLSAQLTDFNSVLSIPKFDPSLGALESVVLTLTGNVEGAIGLENRGPNTANVSANLSSSISLLRPDDNSELLVTLPEALLDVTLPSYDGVFDYGGTSGLTENNLLAEDEESVTYTDAADFALFLGNGTLDLPVFAMGTSSATGPGNVAQFFDTFAGASITVSYTYTENSTAVPEPNAPMGALALVGLGLIAKRKFGKTA